jgi:hypothetical protein
MYQVSVNKNGKIVFSTRQTLQCRLSDTFLMFLKILSIFFVTFELNILDVGKRNLVVCINVAFRYCSKLESARLFVVML